MKRKLETKKVLLSELKEFPGNPNVHPEEQVKAIAESMERYGQYYPIIVDENMMVLCGHGKKKALEYRGEKEASITGRRLLKKLEMLILSALLQNIWMRSSMKLALIIWE